MKKPDFFKANPAIRNSQSDLLREIYRILFRAFGPRHWWPGETPFEVMVGAILTQNTSWTNVEKAIQRLKEEELSGSRRDPRAEDIAVGVHDQVVRVSPHQSGSVENFC